MGVLIIAGGIATTAFLSVALGLSGPAAFLFGLVGGFSSVIIAGMFTD